MPVRWGVLLALLALSWPARAQRLIGLTVESGFAVYGNDDSLTVYSPWAAVTQQAGRYLSVRAAWHADVISSASVDVVSAATRGFDELRNEGSLTLAAEWSRYRASLGYTGSTEHDAHNHTVSASAEVDLLRRNLTIALGYAVSFDFLGQVHEPPSLWRQRTIHALDLVLTWVMARGTIGSLTYTFHQLDGFLSNPYRRVPLFPRGEALEPMRAQWVAERHPSDRGRHALAVDLRQALGRRVALSVRYRGYLDTWALMSQEALLGVSVELGAGLALELDDRFYHQTRASFYRGIYTVNRDYVTRDRRLTTQLSNSARLGLRFRHPRVEVVVQGAFHWTQYDDFWVAAGALATPYEVVLGFVTQVGIRVGF